LKNVQLLPIPKSIVVDSHLCSVKSKWLRDQPNDPLAPVVRIRGNNEWAPPRPQIIIKAPKHLKLKKAMEKQNNRCAGCGTLTSSRVFNRMRYCEYMGKYFCTCCHDNNTAVIPAYVLDRFDFYKYKVSNFSLNHLQQISNEPLFNIFFINHKLYKKIGSLGKVRILREQLPGLHLYIKTCRFSDSIDLILQKNSKTDDNSTKASIKQIFEQLPKHFFNDEFDVFSLNDLISCKNGKLLPLVKQTIESATVHLENCQLCSMKGFICEFCGDEKEIIFPHQNHTFTCSKCKSCFHKKCCQELPCPKCERLKLRKEKMSQT